MSKELAWWHKALIYAAVGVCSEVVFTGLHSLLWGGDLKLTGTTYVWMFPIWGLGALALEPVVLFCKDNAWVVTRIMFYVVAIFMIEYVSGYVLRQLLGQAPWDYSEAALNVNGLIRLDYAPFWGALALGLESLMAFLQRVGIYGQKIDNL